MAEMSIHIHFFFYIEAPKKTHGETPIPLRTAEEIILRVMMDFKGLLSFYTKYTEL